ncbi:MAG: hypothetical protein IJS15_11145 [Victivallales bacterium]|nr:hypothetical protein [Victivallales bacterium]
MIEPRSLEEYRARLSEGGWESYWGHENTLSAAAQECGHDLRPRESRPAVTLDSSGYPSLYGESFHECWVLSPEYSSGFRPALGEEVSLEKISSWQVLRISWD